MEIGILGPLTITPDTAPGALPRGKGQRALFLCLLLRRNETVSVELLAEAVWPGDRPATAVKIVQVYVSQWRKVVGDRLETRSPGYVLHVADGELDANRAQALAARAREAAPADAVLLLDEALALWRGEPLADVRYESFAQPEVARLDELKLALIERRVDAELELGHHAELVPELEALVAAHPLHERFRAQLMLGLYRAGRQADALRVYRDARRTLVDELGLEPGNELQELERSILEHDESVKAPLPPLVERVLRRPWRLALVGAVLVAGAIAAASLELTGGGNAAIVVRPNSVAAIDPASNRVVVDIPAGARPDALAFGFDSVWVANGDSGTVIRIDPHSKRVIAAIGVGGDISDLAIGFGSVWVADGNAGTVTRIDPVQNAVRDTIAFGSQSPLVPKPIFSIATGEGYVWATREDAIVRIDPSTDRPELWLTTTPATGLTVGSGRVWVTTANERIDRYDAAQRDGTPTLEIQTTGAATDPLLADGSLWVLASGELWNIDPESGARHTTPTGISPVATDWQSGSIWVANLGGNVARIDPHSLNVVARARLEIPPAALVSGGGLLWVAVDGAT